MPPYDFESRWIHGLHDPGGEQHMLDAQKPGWIVFTEALGRDPGNRSGKDFRRYATQGFGVICRVNHGYYPNGTLPNSRDYADFAQRVANFVAASPGCRIWIIGNEPNFSVEWPMSTTRGTPPEMDAESAPSGWWRRMVAWWRRMMGHGPKVPGASKPLSNGPRAATGVPLPGYAAAIDDPALRGLPERFSAATRDPGNGRTPKPKLDTPYLGEMITPALYARCYKMCRSAIKRLPDHEQDLVLVAGPAPWNNQTRYSGNDRGDWVQYLTDVLQVLGSNGCDGLALHTYTHGAGLNKLTSEARMRPPFTDRRFEFRTYRDFLQAVPQNMRDLPVYITETDQIEPWSDANGGWVQQAYAEIDEWNRMPGTQKIRALVLYRWHRYDKWAIDGKNGVVADFRAAVARDYRWDEGLPEPQRFYLGDRLRVRSYVNLRRAPGYVGKGPDDIVYDLKPGDELVVSLADSVEADGLPWWRVVLAEANPPVAGWVAQFGPDGAPLVERVAVGTPPTPIEPPAPSVPRFGRGNWVRTLTVVNARRTPGFVGKAAEDIVREVAASTLLQLAEGPNSADGLVWWRVAAADGGLIGWMAETTTAGLALLEQAEAPGQPAVRFRAGDKAMTLAFVRLRRSPGFLDKAADDVIADIWQGTAVTILDGPRAADDLAWWEVECQNVTGHTVRGWMAESAPGGIPLLGEWRSEDRTPFKPRDLGVVGATAVRVRRTPGLTDKPDNDVLGEYRARFTIYMIEGPRSVDHIDWWRASGVGVGGGRLIGWVAQGAANGASLVGRAPRLPNTSIPDLQNGQFIGPPFRGRFGITQLWGENPGFYARYSYDGIALLGHNGIDFGTPSGTPVLATEDGEVSTAGFEAGGFGNHIVLEHAWGQSLYAHLERMDVRPGQRVARGAVLGYSGNTGNSTGPHLHFALRVQPYVRGDGWGGCADPLPYMAPGDVYWPAYMLDAGPQAEPGGPAPVIERRPPSGMAEDAPGLVRP